MLGQVVGSYRITGQIAVGGMGTVFRAEHTLIGRIAAVKVLHPEMTTSREIVTRFFNEAKATSGIKHPGIVEVFDFGYMPSGHAFLVMEYLEGETLAMRMKARVKVTEGEAALLMRGVCNALAAAHAKGVVHRDLKPDNIFIVPEPDVGERTKILDFGIAKLTDVGEGNQHTKAGAVMGTPTYMSPEQCRGTGDVDHRADLYSIGCMLYELVIGRPPFTQTGAGELLGAHLFVEPDPPSRHGPISPELEALIMRLLDKKPERRVQTALELAQILAGIAQATGYLAVSPTDPNVRASLANIPHHYTPAHLTPGVAHFTPMHHTPMHHTPMHHTPMHPAHASAPTTIAPPEKPTTLSGSASQQHPVPTRPRRTFAIVAGVLVLAAAAGIAFVVGTSGQSDDIAATPAAQPAPVEMKAEPTPAVEMKPEPTVVEPSPDAAVADPEPTPEPTPEPKVEPEPTGKKPPKQPPKQPPKETKQPPKQPPKQDKKPGSDLLETDI